jgi:hypothetical protein
MTGIRSLADELRETIRAKTPPAPIAKEVRKPATAGTNHPSGHTPAENGKALKLLERIRSHRLTGHDKLLIRLDDRMLYILKQLKVETGIDMVQFISFSISEMLEKHPELIDYLKHQSLKNFQS